MTYRGFSQKHPYCSGKQVLLQDSLKKIHPEIAKDWDYKKNDTIPQAKTATEVLPTSGSKVWWICKKRHEKLTEIRGRVSSKGCPDCKKGSS